MMSATELTIEQLNLVERGDRDEMLNNLIEIPPKKIDNFNSRKKEKSKRLR